MPISAWRRLLGRICFSLFILCTPLFVSPTSAQSSVVIGEVQWAGSESSSADEWIELWNLSSAPFSLNGYRLRGVGSGSDLVFGPRDQIEPLHSFLISNYNGLDPKSTLVITPQIVTTTISITNENTRIALINPQGEAIDEISWTKTAPGGSNTSPQSSLLRALDRTEITHWITATTSRNLLSTAHQYGTPGFCDGCVSRNEEGTPFTQTLPSPEPPSVQLPINTQDIPTESISESPPKAALPPSQSELEQALEDGGIDSTTLYTELEKETSLDENQDTSSSITYITTTDTEELLPEAEISEDVPNNEVIDIEDEIIDTATTTDIAVDGIGALPPTFTETLSSTSTVTTLSNHTISSTTVQTDIIPSLNEVTTTNLVATTPTSTQVSNPSSEVVNPTINPSFARKSRASFQELFPSPSSGPEWIELSLSANILPTQLTGWSIRDERKNILSIQNTTLFTWNEARRLLVFSLGRNKLTNSGTHLFLIDPVGQIEDEMIMPSIPKNQSWALKEGGTWEKTLLATPGETNQFKAGAPVTKLTTPKKIINAPISKTSIKKTPAKTVTSKTIKQPQSKAPLKKENAFERVSVTSLVSNKTNKNTLTSSSKQKASKKPVPKKMVKKRAASTKQKIKTSVEPQSIDLKDIGPMHASTRVRLTGTVATLPRLLGSNAFVIQTDDGRGLYVSGNSKQPSPAFRSHIILTGTLTVNDDGLILHMYATDRWTTQELERAVQTRVPDLDHPSLEDAWSYIQVRGIVTNVTPTRITMLHDQNEISVSIRPVVAYRAERLKKGDEIEVSGLLDTRKDSLTLLPRLAEEIRLVRSVASTTNMNTAQSRAPLPWMPVGVAGISIVATQGVRRYWKHRLEQKLRFSQPN